jgi:hypothetical protein
MNTIWAFGDSLTFGYGCRPDGPLTEYYNEYRKEGDKVWLEWLGEWKRMKTQNLGFCGASNEYIFDSVLDSNKNIKSGDIVIIGSTIWGRKDIPVEDRWIPLLSIVEEEGEVTGVNTMSIEDRNIIVEYQLRFGEHPLWKDRMIKRFRFLKETLQRRGIEVVLWHIHDEVSRNIEKIRHVSSIDDSHYSFAGHKAMAEYFDKRLKGELI